MAGANGSLVGRVVGVWRYPVKSMLGEELNATVVTQRGLLGDAPDVEKAAVVRENGAAGVDDEDAVERRLLLRAEDRDRSPERLQRRPPPRRGAALPGTK